MLYPKAELVLICFITSIINFIISADYLLYLEPTSNFRFCCIDACSYGLNAASLDRLLLRTLLPLLINHNRRLLPLNKNTIHP